MRAMSWYDVADSWNWDEDAEIEAEDTSKPVEFPVVQLTQQEQGGYERRDVLIECGEHGISILHPIHRGNYLYFSYMKLKQFHARTEETQRAKREANKQQQQQEEEQEVEVTTEEESTEGEGQGEGETTEENMEGEEGQEETETTELEEIALEEGGQETSGTSGVETQVMSEGDTTDDGLPDNLFEMTFMATPKVEKLLTFETPKAFEIKEACVARYAKAMPKNKTIQKIAREEV
eukprot:TRINITY_DN1296_c1_g2_i3.p1 TRINITY_DN1296_c1_g2~~TRINITY_DN1296_c1_g2_i3.p1  ORF type:complete len:235 (+),score=91.40 TRINITY_DN1296_c1_g2_i3:1127-1831(+)